MGGIYKEICAKFGQQKLILVCNGTEQSNPSPSLTPSLMLLDIDQLSDSPTQTVSKCF